MDAFKSFCDRLRVDPATGRKNYIMIQAEDELASIGMVIGANWNGARAFTATSGPGISLMQEFLGLAYYAEVPAVIFDVQRVGPSTGMPTRTQQCGSAIGGLRLARRHAPGVPVPGQSRGMLRIRRHRLRPGRAAADPGAGAVGPGHRHERLDVPGVQVGRELPARPRQGARRRSSSPSIDKFWRYYDHDNDGIPQRTLPGVASARAPISRAARATTSTARYTEDSQGIPGRGRPAAQEMADRRAAGAEADHRARAAADRHRASSRSAAATRAVHEAQQRLRAQGIHADYMRVRGFPFSDEVEQFLQAHRINFVVEQNRDAQLRSLLMHGDRRGEDQACARSCITTACRSRPAMSSMA